MSEVEIQRDLGRKIPPNNAGEDPVLIWIRYGLNNLLYEAGVKFGPEILDQVIPWMDGLNFVVQEAVHDAAQRLREPKYKPVGIMIDTSELTPKGDD